MNKTAIAGLPAVLLILMLPLNASAVPMVSFDIADADIQVGETFTVDVVVDGVDLLDEVIAFGFDVDIESDWSEAAMPVVGPDFVDDSAFFPNTDVAGSVFPGPGPNGDGILLATLSFASSAAGMFDLGILSDHLFDPNEGLRTFNSFDPYDLTHSEQVTINPSASASLPGSFWLLAVGLTGFMSARRHREGLASQTG